MVGGLATIAATASRGGVPLKETRPNHSSPTMTIGIFRLQPKVKQLYRGPAEATDMDPPISPSTTFRWHAILVDQRREVL
jgi:hypothetical protein